MVTAVVDEHLFSGMHFGELIPFYGLSWASEVECPLPCISFTLLVASEMGQKLC